MPEGNEFREYENGVADVFASVVGETGTVHRNVKLPSRSGGRPRQIDVLVDGDVAGITNTRVIVDCKRWKNPIDVADVEAFIGMVEDVGADIGILVSAAGASKGAKRRAHLARGVRIKALSITELNSWRPVGTVTGTFEVPRARLDHVSVALREAGLRVFVMNTSEHAKIEVFRHYGTAHPDGETLQAPQHKLTETILKELRVPYRMISNGVTVGGGTPNYRWIQTYVNGTPFIKTLAATEEELQNQLDMLTREAGVPAGSLTVERPDGWPYANHFPF
jgi:hypothetical protein